ncbi:hypothetical protein K3495_g2326 [Podosphaera aphanis]|nr:hypothetical protein K3495_g2326 [Podosphaera aphanis]
MPPRGRGRGRSGGRVGSGVSKPAITKSSKKTLLRGGSKRGRAKSIPDPPRILALKARKADLNNFFKFIGTHQHSALEDLSQKSLDELENNIKYHESIPEFQRLTDDLNAEYNILLEKLQALKYYEKILAQRTLEQNIHLINEQYKNKLEDLKEESLAKVQEKILYVERISCVRGQIEEIPFCGGEDGRKVTKLVAPPKIVHPVALPFSKGQLADTKFSTKIGDSHLEQHPANFWISRTETQKKAITAQQNSIIEANRKVARDEKRGIYKKRTVTANSLFDPSAVSSMATDIDEDDSQFDDQSGLPDTGTPEDKNQITDISDDAAEMSLDEYGVRIPRKKIRATSKARPNNYMVVPRPFNFEDAEGQILEDGSIGIQEIGFRIWTSKNIKNRDYFIGSGTSPNPEFFFIPQRVGDVNSGNNTMDDMRSVAHICRTHKLHPVLGIVLAQSINPDFKDLDDPYFPPPTDRNCPLEPSKPHIIIQENSDGTKTTYKVQRSWIRQINESFKDAGARNEVKALLRATGNYIESEKYPPDVYHGLGSISQDLIDAVIAALGDKKDELAPNKPTLTPKKSTPRQCKATIPSLTPCNVIQRPFRPQYDPVRDSFPTTSQHKLIATSSTSTNQKPYPQKVSRRATKQTTKAPQNKSMLDELAEHAIKIARVAVNPPSVQKIPPQSSASTIVPPTPPLLIPHSQEILQPKPTIQPPMPSMNMPFQYHSSMNSTQYMKHLVSPNMPQHVPQQCPMNQTMMQASGYSMVYSTHPSTQSIYNSQAPTQSSFLPQSLALPPSYAPLPSQVTFANQPPTPQINAAHSTQNNNTLRELRPAMPQMRAPSQSTISPPVPPPQIYSWNNSGNFYSQSHS